MSDDMEDDIARDAECYNLEENEVPRNVEGIVNEVANDNVRGMNRPNWAREGTEVLEFDEEGHAVAPKKTVTRWQRHLGLMAVDHGLFRIDITDWRQFEGGTKLAEAWQRIKRTINWSDPETKKKAPIIRNVVEGKIHNLWKKHKAILRKQWYLPYLNTEQRWNCTDGRVSKLQWRNLVKHWDTEKAQKVNHSGASPDRCKMFELCHLRKNGTYVDEAGGKAVGDMNSKIDELREIKKRKQLPDELTTEELNTIYEEVIGREKRNRVRTYGLEVRPEDVEVVRPERRGSRFLRLEIEEMQANYEEQIDADADEREERLKRTIREEGRTTSEKVKQLELQLLKQQVMMEKALDGGCNVSNIDSEMVHGYASPRYVSTPYSELGTNRLEHTRRNAALHAPYMASLPSIAHQDLHNLAEDGYRPVLRGMEVEPQAENSGLQSEFEHYG